MKPFIFTIAAIVCLSGSFTLSGQTLDKTNYDDVIFSD